MSKKQKKEFEEWLVNVHADIEDELDLEGKSIEDLSGSGYWKVMCVAAWSEKRHFGSMLSIVKDEHEECLKRETETEIDFVAT